MKSCSERSEVVIGDNGTTGHEKNTTKTLIWTRTAVRSNSFGGGLFRFYDWQADDPYRASTGILTMTSLSKQWG